MASTAPSIHPSIACGPPITVTMSGIVINGPTPIMSIMFSAVAEPSPMPRMSCGLVSGSPSSGMVMKWVVSRWPFVVGELVVGRLRFAFVTPPRATNDQRLTTSYQIHKQPYRPRHTRRQLPEERIPRVDIYPLAVMRHQQSALLLG